MLSKSGCCVRHYSSAHNPINHARDYQVHSGRREDGGDLGALSAAHHRRAPAVDSAVMMRREWGWMYCCGGAGQSPPGALSSHCYVISSLPGLVWLWVVSGLSILISQALSASRNQRWLCARPAHPCLLFVKPTNQPGQPLSVIYLSQTGLSLCLKSTHASHQGQHQPFIRSSGVSLTLLTPSLQLLQFISVLAGWCWALCVFRMKEMCWDSVMSYNSKQFRVLQL